MFLDIMSVLREYQKKRFLVKFVGISVLREYKEFFRDYCLQIKIQNVLDIPAFLANIINS